jgi:hypothetical protein
MVASVPVQTYSHEPAIAPLDQESFVDEVPARPAPVRIDSGSQTVAFGSLLETPTDEKDDDIGFPPAVNPDLATEHDWRDPGLDEPEEELEEEKPAATWRHDEGEYADGGSASGAKDWRSGSFEQILARKAKGESWEPVEEKPEVVETAPVASSFVSEAPPAPAAIPEAPAHTEPVISTTPFASDAWAAASSPDSQEKRSAETTTAVEEVARVKDHEPSSTETVVAAAPEVRQAEPQTKAPQEPWFSVPSNPWNTEIEKANRLAEAWDAAVPAAGPPASSNGTEKATEAVSETAQQAIEGTALPAATVEAIREEAAQVAEVAAHASEQQTSEGGSFYAPEALVETPAATPAPAPSMDDLVARVLARMSPEVLQAVTREILKPVVEAMVKEEMNSRKS